MRKMRKILTIGLAVLLSVFLGSMLTGGQAYAFSGEGPSITADIVDPAPGIAYENTLSSADPFAMNGEHGPSIAADIVDPAPSLAYDNTLSRCLPSYALNGEHFSGPVVSSEFNGAVKGTDDEITLFCACWTSQLILRLKGRS